MRRHLARAVVLLQVEPSCSIVTGDLAIGHRGAVEVLLREPPFAVRAVEQRHLAIVDHDVGMMIGGFGVGNQTVDERDGRRKIVERELLPDRAALERPVLQRPSADAALPDRTESPCQYSPNRCGFVARQQRILTVVEHEIGHQRAPSAGASSTPFRKWPVAYTSPGILAERPMIGISSAVAGRRPTRAPTNAACQRCGTRSHARIEQVANACHCRPFVESGVFHRRAHENRAGGDRHQIASRSPHDSAQRRPFP